MEDQSIYQILKQNNVYYTIFKEIDTIVFDVKNSSQKLINKIVKSSCQYEDTFIILDLGINHSKNVMRRIIKVLKNIDFQSPKVILRFKQNNMKSIKNILDYINIVPSQKGLQELIFFQPQNNVEIQIKSMGFSFLSHDKLLLSVNEIEIEINYRIIDNKQDQQTQRSSIIIDEKTKMNLLSNLEEVIIYNLPLYGLSKENFTFIIESIDQIVVSFDIEEIELPKVFVDNLVEFLNTKTNIFINMFAFSFRQKLEIDDLFDNLIQICDTSQKISHLKFQIFQEELVYVPKFNSITVNISDLLCDKGSFYPLFKIQNKIDILKIYFKIQKSYFIDLCEFIQRCRQLIFIKQIEVEVIYSEIWKNFQISIGDIFDLLSKLKNLHYYSIQIQKKHSFHPQFALIYNKQQETYIIQQIEDLLDLVPQIAFNKTATNLKIQYTDNLVSVQQFHKNLIQLIKSSNLKRIITLSFNKLCRNHNSLVQSNDLIQNFQFVSLIFENTNSLSIFQINKDDALKVREIQIFNQNWLLNQNLNISIIINKFPNIIKVNLNNRSEQNNPINQKNIKSIQKYINVKRSLFLIAKKLQLKRKEMLSDLILEFLS
ncbi:hypothetical protein TTHERM_00731430 (macronuclear) [Tetrahymena thermophila SB210]|uniref:Uncharacterized protein n=1 Tax=Tetrahymena thermophila (strain SB210) TaxID=312017 RepID=Q245G9_TETTS|nr:hypothetical protein TTHERM_00731430 [Tetrahymena thermophila SB210]EAS03395.2 hypothetical protein TTHERM_00731430 [Tetrahymena thermophila SB210]|eukprot:XP_001023640.2 hypothetical protein TTHERM_00731430 [Tetrahymena thermophila SB210]